jgi:hypothetical protein
MAGVLIETLLWRQDDNPQQLNNSKVDISLLIIYDIREYLQIIPKCVTPVNVGVKFPSIRCDVQNHHAYCHLELGTGISASPDILIPALSQPPESCLK